ncbi:MAG: UDP-N-acetylglucosamine--N-acetylmuramyl-(pentapeptide) pyrophosphoryl-undecaprenol N-acetylglucosamine transferase [Candidatus Omnitrophica bacterium]|nr:UDP-N-acetylglucosamine--N-acetylmuramyl-(pentapeptide) pyrophosphoryl-undecaprenol N-acetylglucosamine transferase [Candidatus Omnitrophota bacterium]
MKVVIACGGSGGHLYPGLSLAATLREQRKDVETIFVVTRKPLDRKIVGKEKMVLALPVVGMPPIFSWRFPIFLIQLTYSFMLCLAWMIRIHPDIFVGFGGYVSGPVILTGVLLRKPTFIHEENLVPGRANLFLSRWATRVGVAFEETQKFFRRPVIHVGNPLRKDLAPLQPAEAREALGLKRDHFTLLVMGGSQGAHRLNRAMVELFERFPHRERADLQLIHLAGEKDALWVEERYRSLEVIARVYPFLQRMGEAYSAADLVIARGGAMTITEIAHFRKVALLVPLALARNHQGENVRYLARHGACLCYEEESIATESFLREILSLKKDDARRKVLSETLASLCPNRSAGRLAQEVIALTQKETAHVA